MSAPSARPSRRLVVEHIASELARSTQATNPWPHLERAHILSQPFAWPHTKVHLVMLRQGFRERDAREVVGQLVRVVVAGPGSRFGKFPVGNTGRATMRLTAVGDVPADLAAILSPTATTATN